MGFAMSTQLFHEGQEVEVRINGTLFAQAGKNFWWRKAKIVFPGGSPYWVQFPDGSRALFDAEHIRAVTP